jgi:hypothetical protein
VDFWGVLTMLRNPICRLDVRAVWATFRQQFAAVVAERDALRQELADRTRERDEILATLNELIAARAAVVQAEAELASLHRERSIQRARTAERDPGQPLN